MAHGVLIGTGMPARSRASIALAAVLASSCAQPLGHLAVLAPGAPDARVATGPRVRGESCATWLFGLPLGAPSLEAAARAAQAGRAAPLADVVVTRTSWSAAVVGRECLVVEAALTTR